MVSHTAAQHSEWMTSLISHGRILDSSKKGEEGGLAGKVELGHRFEDGAGRKAYEHTNLFEGQSRRTARIG